MNNARKQIGMYVHIPFCVKKCSYCDFLSAPADSLTRQRYAQALLDEIRSMPKPDKEEYVMRSVFFGGGTPSVLEPQLTEAVLRELLAHYEDISHKCGGADDGPVEISIECNPGTVTEEKIGIYRRAGFNRISFGLQSAVDKELESIGRIHTREDFIESFRLARAGGFDNINIDLMFGLPYQTEESWRATLEYACSLKPEHISAYGLIPEEGTPLAAQLEAARERKISLLPDEQTERQMYYTACEILGAYGYEQYEISNFALPGKMSIHNLSYWECREYLGFGIGASSYHKDMRYKNTPSLERYLNKGYLVKEDIEYLDLKDKMSEFMFLGLRKVRDGVSKSEFEKRFKASYDEIFGRVTEDYVGKGLLDDDGSRIVLTRRGIDVSNVVMADFLL